MDRTKSDNEWHYVPLTREWYWMIAVDKISVAGTAIPFKGVRGIVDSGTSILVGDSVIVAQIEELLPLVEEDCSNYAALPNIDFEINGRF